MNLKICGECEHHNFAPNCPPAITFCKASNNRECIEIEKCPIAVANGKSRELQQGQMPMTIFDDRFDEESYCWLNGKDLWLSWIHVKPEFQQQGVLTELIQKVKTIENVERIIVPTPSKIVYDTFTKHGFEYSLLEEEDEMDIEVMVWKPRK